ncbi:hypothetical protein CK203_098233 [Vitis vinifera]|uniref:Uncharacterized protein n=1 Tax=Vitis vinifera TaxID=29760 RepID=A0A438FID2_VITVI|nr:hypothetical protein CK203_098233 [Vitis vinifera]
MVLFLFEFVLYWAAEGEEAERDTEEWELHIEEVPKHREDDGDQVLYFFSQVDMRLVARVLNGDMKFTYFNLNIFQVYEGPSRSDLTQPNCGSGQNWA